MRINAISGYISTIKSNEFVVLSFNRLLALDNSIKFGKCVGKQFNSVPIEFWQIIMAINFSLSILSFHILKSPMIHYKNSTNITFFITNIPISMTLYLLLGFIDYEGIHISKPCNGHSATYFVYNFIPCFLIHEIFGVHFTIVGV